MEENPKKILYNRKVAAGYYRMGISWKTPAITAGQFVMVRVGGGLDPLLRRPFGVYDMIGSRGGPRGTGIEILYKVVGAGTRVLAARRPGDFIDVMGPLGNGFPFPSGFRKVILVAGGMGIVPLYLLAKELRGAVLLFGARKKEEAVFIKDFRKFTKSVRAATEDGSYGRNGLVTELLEEELSPGSAVYACGPSGMLKAASLLAARHGAKCFVSLERPMACGIGACLGCAVKMKPRGEDGCRYRMVCSDGPVFDGEEIDWDSF